MPLLSITTFISFELLSCHINSRQAPQGGKTFHILLTAITVSISISPSEQSVSIQTPV